MIPCDESEHKIALYVDHELSGAEALELEAHLTECARCRLAYEDLRAASLYRDPVRIAFDIRAGKYSICGNEFDPSRQPLEIKLGAVDEFVLSTLNAVKPRHHPFHMHVNPFQQIAVNNTPLAQPIWRDTVIVEKDQPVTVRMRPVTFTGDSVIHCPANRSGP